MTASPINHMLVEQYVRSFARGNMRDTVRITRSGDSQFDSATGTLQAGSPVVVYEGPARVYPASGPVNYSLGDEPQYYSSTSVSIPIMGDDNQPVNAPQVNDVVTITVAPGDPEMAGRTFTIQDVEAGGQWSAVRRLQCVGIQSSPGWAAQ